MALASFDPAELGRFTRAFEDFFDRDDPESMTSYYTENAQFMADGIQPIHGHAAIGRFWREAITRASAAGSSARTSTSTRRSRTARCAFRRRCSRRSS